MKLSVLPVNMRRKYVLRLTLAVFVSVIVWILWFSLSFDVEESGTQMVSELGSRLYIAGKPKPVKVGEEIDLPDNLNDLDIPQLQVDPTSDSQYDAEKVTGVTFKNRVFYLNGKAFRIFSGAVHYFRIVPQYWEDRLKKLKACGLNTVETYVPWTLHEPSPGVYNFNGMLDLRKFIRLAEQLGLYVILRPGPFICSEFEFGGLPGWLLHDPSMKVRTNHPGYVAAVRSYFGVLLPMVNDLQFTEGGPIIMYQVENEYSAYGNDIEHLKLLLYLMKKLGVKELPVVSDHQFHKKYAGNKALDFSKYALLTDNFQRIGSNSFSIIRSLNKHFPVMVMEFWTGWFDAWGQGYHSTQNVEVLNKTLNFILDEGGSFNLYMFIGGTNFGFTSGANNFSEYRSLVTSYDYDAILSEAGDITPKYHMVRDVLQNFYSSLGLRGLPEPPPDTPKGDYGYLEMTEMLEWDVFISLIPIATTDNKVNFMEMYRDRDGQHNSLGYIIYSYYLGDDTHWNKLPGVQLTSYVKDRLTAIMNSEIFYIKDELKAEEEDLFLPYDWDEKFQEKLRRQQDDVLYEHLSHMDFILSVPQWPSRYLRKLKSDPYEFMFNYSLEYDEIFKNPVWLFTFLYKAEEMGKKLKKKDSKVSGRLDLMVENQGRVNYSPGRRSLLDGQRKGLHGPVFRYIFGIMEEWHIRFLNFNQDQYKILSKSSTWSTVEEVKKRRKEKEEKEKVAPTLYRAYLNVTGTPKDTFVKLEGWTKGVVIVNGFNLGRYWHVGPQRTLYLPAPILKTGRNEILVFEEFKRGKAIRFQSEPELR